MTIDLQKKRVLITGGAGFIGANMAMELVRRGYRVTILDIDDYGRLDGQDIEFVQGNVLDKDTTGRLVAGSDLIFHMAAVAGITQYIKRPRDVLDTNIMGSRNVVDACAIHKKPLVLISTSEVYGTNSVPLSEDANKVIGRLRNARWCYSVSKMAAEEYAHASQGLLFTIIRYFNVYGPSLDSPGKGRVIARFLGSIRDNKPITLVGGGQVVRSFCYVDDAVEATLRLGLGLVPGAPFARRAVNVGRYEPVTIRELAEMVARLSGHQAGFIDVPGEVFYGPGFEEIPYRIPDVSFLKEVTGFEARTTLEAGLRRTLSAWGLLRGDAPRQQQATLPFVKPQVEPDDGLIQDITLVLNSGRLSNDGPHVRALETEAANFLGTGDAVAVSSGSAALRLAVKAVSQGKAGVAILPSYTYIATLAAVMDAGLQPVFCDIDPHTFTMAPQALKEVIEHYSNVKLVLPVTVFGVWPDMPAIMDLANKAGSLVILDNSHGFGTQSGGQRVPPGPVAITFSLHATKIVPAGEGGLVVSSDPGLLAEIRRLRNHGLADAILNSIPSENAKMAELPAVVARHALKGLPDVLNRRRAYAARAGRFVSTYADGLLAMQSVPAGMETNFQNLAIRFTKDFPGGTTQAIGALRSTGVEARRYFWPPLHHLQTWKGRFVLPNTDLIADTTLCLPIYSRMSDRELDALGQGIKALADRYEK